MLINRSGHCPVRKVGTVVSKLYALLLVIASLFLMSAIGLGIVAVVAHVSHLAFATNSEGMVR